MIYGALEAGGTKMICAVCKENGEILEQCSIPTREPEITVPEIISYFKDKNIVSLGIACFGPIDLDKDSPTYGYITATPKLQWQNYPLLPVLKEALSVPMGFDTDVNGSLLGELTYGDSQGIENAVYITIGTGIGGGVCANGRLLHGMLHPELGHMKMVPHKKDSFPGVCPFHKSCFEGMASGPAIEARYGKKGSELFEETSVWEIEAYYIGQALCNIILTLSPERIILGGGVMHQTQLFPLIREEVKKQLNGYIKTKELEEIEHYIVPASLNDNQGVLGCLKLAIDAKKEERE